MVNVLWVLYKVTGWEEPMALGVYDSFSSAKSAANVLLNQSIISRNSEGNFWLWNGLEHLHWEEHYVNHYYESYRLWEVGRRFDQGRFRIIPTKLNNFFFRLGIKCQNPTYQNVYITPIP